MIAFIQGLILTSIEVLCCNIFFRTFLEKRYEKKIYLNAMALVIFSLSFFGISVIEQKSYLLKAIYAVLYIVVFMSAIYKGGFVQKVFFAICFYGILMAIDSGLIILVQYLYKDNMEVLLENSLSVIIMGLLCKAVLFLTVILINRKFSKEDYYELLADNEWISFLFFPIFTIVAILLFLLDRKVEERTVLTISIGLVFTNYLLFHLIRGLVHREKENQQLSLRQERTKSQIELYENMKLSHDELKSKAHEYKNHIDCIQGLLQEKEIEKVKEYVSSINKDIESHTNYFNTSNALVNAIINQKYRQAKEKQIVIMMTLNNLADIPIKEEDLVVLLANLFDNAIEACERLELEERYIKFKFVQEKDKIVLSMKNKVKVPVPIVNQKITTTKEDRRNHGLGLENVKAVVEKYKGEGLCYCEDKNFCYTAVFWKNTLQVPN